MGATLATRGDAAIIPTETLIEFISDLYQRIVAERGSVHKNLRTMDTEATYRALTRIIDRFDVSHDDADLVMDLIGFHPDTDNGNPSESECRRMFIGD